MKLKILEAVLLPTFFFNAKKLTNFTNRKINALEFMCYFLWTVQVSELLENILKIPYRLLHNY